MQQRITAQDLLCLEKLSDAQISPDAASVAYVVRTRDWEAKSTLHQIWLVDLQSRNGYPVSPAEETCTSPRWSPDGRVLAWLNHAGNACRLQLHIAEGDSESKLTSIDLPVGAHNIAWAPGGGSIAFLLPELSPLSQVMGVREVGGETANTDLCLLDPWSCRWNRLTNGRFSVVDYAWSPASDRIVVCATPTGRPQDWDRGDVWIVSPCGAADPAKLLAGRCRRAIWSPGGLRLAVLRLGSRSFLDTPTVEVLDLEGNIAAFDPFREETQLLAWDEDGVLALSIEGCSSHLYRMSPSTGATCRVMPAVPEGFSLIEGWFGQGCSVSRDGRAMAFTAYDATHPGEVAALDLHTGRLEYLTRAMQRFCDWDLPAPEVFTWNASDGTPLSGILMRPNTRRPEFPRPLVIALHGGPTAMASQAPLADNDWIWAAIPLMLQRGALVLLPDYRGSIGYGPDFRQMNQYRIGLANLDDIQSAIASLVSSGWVDDRRVAAVGASHGGYLAALLATATDCLATAVCRSGITDWTLNYQLNQNPEWERQYFGGTPWDQPERYQAASPTNYVSCASTPILFIHGDQDRQAPTANAYALHRGLQDKGIPTRLVILEGVGHGGGSLDQLEYGMIQTVEWIERWLGMDDEMQ